MTLNERHTFFGRFELSQKDGHDLGVDAGEAQDIFTVAKLQAGYTRYFAPRYSLAPGIGAGVSAGIVPESLKSTYGGRITLGLGVCLTVRPGT